MLRSWKTGGLSALTIAALSAGLLGCSTSGPRTDMTPTMSSPPSPDATLPVAPTAPEMPGVRPTAVPGLVPPTVATFQPSGGATAEWNLVALGDSNVAGSGINEGVSFSPEDAYPGVYAAFAAEDGID